jgi:8-oxo-dGTP diphosphatase
VKTIHVVAGALLRDENVLIAQRPPGKHLAGGWEFPGGKLASDESPIEGLKRELREELGIDAVACEPIAQCTHTYPDRCVLLELWLVREFIGQPQSLDGQALKWVALRALPEADLLPADAPLLEALIKYLS